MGLSVLSLPPLHVWTAIGLGSRVGTRRGLRTMGGKQDRPRCGVSEWEGDRGSSREATMGSGAIMGASIYMCT